MAATGGQTAQAKPDDGKVKTEAKHVEVVREGSKIVLPVVNGKPMGYDEAIEWMRRKRDEDERVVGLHHDVPCSPLDGAVAFHRALAEKFGWTGLTPTPGFFGDTPPTMIGVPVGPGETIQVAWGRVQVPGVTGFLQTVIDIQPPKFVIGGEVRQKHLPEVQEIADLTRRLLAERSIYKGRAIKVSFAWKRAGRPFNPLADAPQFFPVAGVEESDLVFPAAVRSALDIGLFTPIEQAAACRKFRVPLKRGVLLYGPYGVGKSLTATVTAIKAQRHGFTFVYLDSVEDLADGLTFAAQYAPAVVFCEDIDRATSGERDIDMDEILNVLDGVNTKGGEVITVFTTNHVEDINPAVLRMGRLDTLVKVSAPDADAAEQLVRLYARGLLEPDADLKRIGLRLAGRIPAFIRETVERAKIAAIGRSNGGDITGRVLEADLLAAAEAMQAHADLLEPRPERADWADDADLFVRVPPGRGTQLAEYLGHANGHNRNGDDD